MVYDFSFRQKLSPAFFQLEYWNTHVRSLNVNYLSDIYINIIGGAVQGESGYSTGRNIVKNDKI